MIRDRSAHLLLRQLPPASPSPRTRILSDVKRSLFCRAAFHAFFFKIQIQKTELRMAAFVFSRDDFDVIPES